VKKVHLARTYHADMEEAESLQQDSKDKVLRMRMVSQVGVMRAGEPGGCHEGSRASRLRSFPNCVILTLGFCR
jgi:hypothetical protein